MKAYQNKKFRLTDSHTALVDGMPNQSNVANMENEKVLK